MIDPVTMNAGKPRADAHGMAMLNRMNEHHKALYKWGLEHISLDAAHRILDIGCGGGQNLHNISRIVPTARLYGLDHSQASIQKCADVNREAIESGILELCVGSAEQLPYEPGSFDLVTAFETVYYWPNIQSCFENVCRTLDERGCFLVCNEDSSLQGNEELAEALHMTFYNEQALRELMLAAGFRTVHTYHHEHCSWVCAVGRK